MPPGVGFWLVFIGLGVGVLKSFLPGGWGIRPSKRLPEGFARGMVRLGIDLYISPKRRIIKTFSLNLHISDLDH